MSPAVVKVIVALATDKRTWKALAVIITAVLTPIILAIFFLMVSLTAKEEAAKAETEAAVVTTVAETNEEDMYESE